MFEGQQEEDVQNEGSSVHPLFRCSKVLNQSLDNSSGLYITLLIVTSLIKLDEEHRLIPLPGSLIVTIQPHGFTKTQKHQHITKKINIKSYPFHLMLITLQAHAFHTNQDE